MAALRSLSFIRPNDTALKATMATTSTEYASQLQEKKESPMIKVPICCDDQNPFIAPVHMITPVDMNIKTWMRQLCFRCRLALETCCCKRDFELRVFENGLSRWKFKKENLEFERFAGSLLLEIQKYHNDQHVYYVLLPQYALGFLQGAKDLQEKYGDLRERFGCKMFYIHKQAPPSKKYMGEFFTFYEAVKEAKIGSGLTEKGFDAYLMASCNFQHHLLGMVKNLKVPEEGEIAFYRHKLSQKRRKTDDDDEDDAENQDDRQPTHYGQNGRPRNTSDNIRDVAQYPAKYPNVILNPLTNAAPHCCRSISAPPLVLSQSQQSTALIWQRPPKSLATLIGDISNGKVQRLRFRGDAVQEVPSSAGTDEERSAWILEKIHQYGYMNIIARWCSKQIHGDVKKKKLRSIIEDLWLSLREKASLPKHLQGCLPNGVLLECIPSVYAIMPSGSIANFHRSPQVSDNMVVPVMSDACDPETQTIGLPVLIAKKHGADFDGDKGGLRIPENEFKALQLDLHASYEALRWTATGHLEKGISGWAEHAVNAIIRGGHQEVSPSNISGNGNVYWRGGRELRLGRALVEQALACSGHGYCWIPVALPSFEVRELKVQIPKDAPALSLNGWFPVPAFDKEDDEREYLHGFLRYRGWSKILVSQTTVVGRRWSATLNMPSDTTLLQYVIASIPQNDPTSSTISSQLQEKASIIIDPSDEEMSDSEEEDTSSITMCLEDKHEKEDLKEPLQKMVKLIRLPDYEDGVIGEMPMYHSSNSSKSLNCAEKNWLRFSTALANLFCQLTGLHHFTCITCEISGNVQCGACGHRQSNSGTLCQQCMQPYLCPPEVMEQSVACPLYECQGSLNYHYKCDSCWMCYCSQCLEEKGNGKVHVCLPNSAKSPARLYCSLCQGTEISEKGKPCPYRRLELSWAAAGVSEFQVPQKAEDTIKSAIRRCTWRPKAEDCRMACAHALRDEAVKNRLIQKHPGVIGLLDLSDFMSDMACLAIHFMAAGAFLAAEALYRYNDAAAYATEPEKATMEQLLEHYHLRSLGHFILEEGNDIIFKPVDFLHQTECGEHNLEEVHTCVMKRLKLPESSMQSRSPAGTYRKFRKDAIPLYRLRLRRPFRAVMYWRFLSEYYGFRKSEWFRRRTQGNWRRIIRAMSYRQQRRFTVDDVAQCAELQLGGQSGTAVKFSFFQMGSAMAMAMSSGIACNDIVPLDDTPVPMLSSACNAVINAYRLQAVNCKGIDYQADVRSVLVQNMANVLRVGIRAHLYGHDIGPLVALTASHANVTIQSDDVIVDLRKLHNDLNLESKCARSTIELSVTPDSRDKAFRQYTSSDGRYLLKAVTPDANFKDEPKICHATGRWSEAFWYLTTSEREHLHVGTAAAWMPPASVYCKVGPDSRHSVVSTRMRKQSGCLRHHRLRHVLEPQIPLIIERSAGVGAKPEAQAFTIAPTVSTSNFQRATRESGILGDEISHRSLIDLQSMATTEAIAIKALLGSQEQKKGVSMIGRCRKATILATDVISLQHGRLIMAPYVDKICRNPLNPSLLHGEICGERLRCRISSRWYCRKCGDVPAPTAVSLWLAQSGHALNLIRRERQLWGDWRCPQNRRFSYLRGSVRQLNEIFDTNGEILTLLPQEYEVCSDDKFAELCSETLDVYIQSQCSLRCRRRLVHAVGGEMSKYKRLKDLPLDGESRRSWMLRSNEVILVWQKSYSSAGFERHPVVDLDPDNTLDRMVSRLPQMIESEELHLPESHLNVNNMEAADDPDDSDMEISANLEGVAWAPFEVAPNEDMICNEVRDTRDLDEALSHIQMAMPPSDVEHSAGVKGNENLIYAADVPCPNFQYTFNGFSAVPPIQAEYYGNADKKQVSCPCGEESHYRLLAHASPFRRPSLMHGEDLRRSLTSLCDNCISKLDAREVENERETSNLLVALGNGATLHSEEASFGLHFYSIYAELVGLGVPLKLPFPHGRPKLISAHWQSNDGITYEAIAMQRSELNECTDHLQFFLEDSMSPWQLAIKVGDLRRGKLESNPTSVMSKHYLHPMMSDMFQATGPATALNSIKGPGPAAMKRSFGAMGLLGAITSVDAHQLDGDRATVIWGNSTRKRTAADPVGHDHLIVHKRRMNSEEGMSEASELEQVENENDTSDKSCVMEEDYRSEQLSETFDSDDDLPPL